MQEMNITAGKSLDLLMEGNNKYLNAKYNSADISINKRENTFTFGQHPFAIIVTCSDSRVIPEAIFTKGIGELFVIRVAGNVLDNAGIGSVEYAAEHLGCKLVMVMGHTGCGAIASSTGDLPNGYLRTIIEEIKMATKDATKEQEKTELNVRNSVNKLKNSEEIKKLEKEGLKIIGAIYHTENGKVELL